MSEGPFYINMGRWADSVIGPFESREDANWHLNEIDWRGSKPTIVTIAPPSPGVFDVEFSREWANGEKAEATLRVSGRDGKHARARAEAWLIGGCWELVGIQRVQS